MKKDYVFTESSSLEHYSADAFTVRCFDDRFWKIFKHFLKSLEIRHIDPSSVAGGAKIFAMPEKESDRDFMFREIEKSIKLHHTKKVMLFTHTDCGALRGLSNFNNNKEEEFLFHLDMHSKTRKAVLERFPNIQVETHFIDEGGIVKTSE
ncbi:MAG TPA: carbonic anhydrase [Candidatus Paceibacterota bacterium]